MNAPRKKFGFSLAEILVAIAIVAVVAAVVIPSIGGQLRSGDESRVQQDLTNIRSGVEQFLADVRRYPKDVGQLTVIIDSTAKTGLTGGVYTPGQVKRWRGPYLTKDSASMLKTGFDATINAAFIDTTVSSIRYLVIRFTTFDSTNAFRLDQKMDDGVITTGQIRWVVGTSPNGVLSYYALPIQ